MPDTLKFEPLTPREQAEVRAALTAHAASGAPLRTCPPAPPRGLLARFRGWLGRRLDNTLPVIDVGLGDPPDAADIGAVASIPCHY